MIKVFSLYHGKDWRKDLFLFDRRARFNFIDDRWLNVKTIGIVASATRNELSAFAHTLFDIFESCPISALIYHRGHVSVRLCRLADLSELVKAATFSIKRSCTFSSTISREQ